MRQPQLRQRWQRLRRYRNSMRPRCSVAVRRFVVVLVVVAVVLLLRLVVTVVVAVDLRRLQARIKEKKWIIDHDTAN